MSPPSGSEIARKVIGAWRLFKFDPSGAQVFNNDPRETIQSFWAAAIYAPFFILLLTLVSGDMRAGASFPFIVIVESLFYVIVWAAWPLAASYFVRWLNLDENYCRYISAYNWAIGPQIAFALAVFIAETLFALGDGFSVALFLTLLIWLLAYHAYILRTILGARTHLVLLLVASDFILSEVLFQLCKFYYA